jgi:hypothetical protein
LTKLNLIKRTKFLSLTSFGIVIYDGKKKIDPAIDRYYNLKAVDSIERTEEIDHHQRRQLIKDIVTDEGIRKVLLGEL